MRMIKQIEKILPQIITLCQEHEVEYMALFGSAAKNDMHENSDVDFLIQFSDEIDVLDYADNYFSLKEKMETLIGKKIDLISKKSLKNPILIEEIDRSKIDLYAA